MQHTQQDETILRTEPKEDIDDLIFRADPALGRFFPATLFTISTLLDII